MRARVTLRSIDHQMPWEPISPWLEDRSGDALNRGPVRDPRERGSAHAALLEESPMARLRPADLVHWDETGLRVAGRWYGLHPASTSDRTHGLVHDKRGQEALTSAASVRNDFTGSAVPDGGAPSFKFTQARPVLGGAHRRRAWNGRKADGSRWAAAMHPFLRDLHHRPRPLAVGDEVQKPYQTILEPAEQEEPPPRPSPRGKPKPTPGRHLLDRWRTPHDGVRAFAWEAGVPFPNNQAARDLRPSKVKLQVSGGFRTVQGAHLYARIQAVLSTFRQQGHGVFGRLRELFSPPSAAVV